MTDDFRLFGVTPTATLEEIRERYLALVRQFPPDRNPDRFHEIRAAYERLSDPRVWLENQIFGAEEPDSIDQIIAEMSAQRKIERIPTKLLLSLGEGSC